MSDIWPTLSYRTNLEPAAISAPTARGIMRSICADAHMVPGAVDTALLLVSELVTNTITHGRGSTAALGIDLLPDRIHVSVTDDAPGTPHVVHEPVTSEHGRGLFLVETLASRWGVERHGGHSKSVWFELDRIPPTPPTPSRLA